MTTVRHWTTYVILRPIMTCRHFRMPKAPTLGAVTLLGHPGIGKSLWAILVLVLRILAGHPTIYHSQSQICYVFNADGLYVVNLGDAGLQSGHRRFYDAISSNYWCLV
ncbi:hypothetical protein JB92DRAFT_2943287, partial [Gautieria morchelliformis]